MNYRIRFHPFVARDLDAIAQWILDYAAPEIALALRAIPAGRKAVVAFVVDDDAREVLIYAVSYGGADWAMRSSSRSR